MPTQRAPTALSPGHSAVLLRNNAARAEPRERVQPTGGHQPPHGLAGPLPVVAPHHTSSPPLLSPSPCAIYHRPRRLSHSHHQPDQRQSRAEQSGAEPTPPARPHTRQQPPWRAPASSASRCSASSRRTPPSPRNPRHQPPRPPPPRPLLPPRRRRPHQPPHRPPHLPPPPPRPQRHQPPRPPLPPPPRHPPPQPPRHRPRHRPRLPPRRRPPRPPPRPPLRPPRPSSRLSRRPSPRLPSHWPPPPFPPSQTHQRPPQPRRRRSPPRRRRARLRPPLPSSPRPPPSPRRLRPPRQPTTPRPLAPLGTESPPTPRAPSRQWQGASCRRARWRWASPPSWPRHPPPPGEPVRSRRRDVPRHTTQLRCGRTLSDELCATSFCAVFHAHFPNTAWAGRPAFLCSSTHVPPPRILSPSFLQYQIEI